MKTVSRKKLKVKEGGKDVERYLLRKGGMKRSKNGEKKEKTKELFYKKWEERKKT